MRSMTEMDRRGALRTLFGGVLIAGAGVSLWPQDAAAVPDLRLINEPAPNKRGSAARMYAQNGRPLPAPVHRPGPRRRSWSRRGRRWVCWWHRGRRHCGWRW